MDFYIYQQFWRSVNNSLRIFDEIDSFLEFSIIFVTFQKQIV